MTDDSSEDIHESREEITFAEFLESTPPATLTPVSDVVSNYQSGIRVSTPEIQLHCSTDPCNGTRFFRFAGSSRPTVSTEDYSFFYLTYRCSNCRSTEKTFAIAAKNNEVDYAGECYKFGELPVYGPPTPPRLIKLIGPDRDSFLKGRRCENLGLGIGAFVYYRRVVENQKNRILDEIIKVAKRLEVPKDHIDSLEQAKSETQFSKAMSMVKDAIPQSLLINGHNPLTLLHSALSEGLHDRTDEQCLNIAGSIRVVLGELSDRLGQALKDEAEINKALTNLLNRGQDG